MPFFSEIHSSNLLRRHVLHVEDQFPKPGIALPEAQIDTGIGNHRQFRHRDGQVKQGMSYK